MRWALAVLAAMLVGAAPAQAHDSHGWYWGDYRAEQRIKVRYHTYANDCTGFGQWIWSDYNAYGQRAKLYRHFDCFFEDDDGAQEGILHVKGRFAFSLYLVG